MRSKPILLASSALLLAGYGITFMQGWGDAPAALALPVKAYGLVFVGSRNGLFEGFFYVAVGALLGMKYRKLSLVPAWFEIILVAFGLVGTVFVSNDAHLPFCALAGVGMFLLSVRRCGVGMRPHVRARNASTIIYLVHMYFVVLFVYGICGGAEADLFTNEVDRLALYLFTLGGSAAVSAIVIRLAKRMPALKTVFGI